MMLTCVLILIAIIGMSGYLYYQYRKGLQYCLDVVEIQSAFLELSNPGRYSTVDELKDFLSENDELFDEIRSFVALWYIPVIITYRERLEDALRWYESIADVHRQNNDSHTQIVNSIVDSENLWSKLSRLFAIDHFVSHSELNGFISANNVELKRFLDVYSDYSKWYVFDDEVRRRYEALNDPERLRHQHNQGYIESQLKNGEQYFDTLLKYPLDWQQRRAIVGEEDNTLVISGAGSGKTSTIISKARYLLDIKHADPSKLLIITYTRKAACELTERLNNKDVECCTFHSLAYKIIVDCELRKPSICEQSLLLNVFIGLLNRDEKFKKAVLKYILHQQSLMKVEHEYDNIQNYLADRKKYGILAPYPDANGNMIFTRSEEEKRICTLLAEMGVDFLYEEPYEYRTYSKEYRQYKPDFTILVKRKTIDPHTGAESSVVRRVYLEHFAIDSSGNVPKWFGDRDPIGGWPAENRRYKDGIKWKRHIHTQNNTTLIETTSADFHSGCIEDVLKQKLRDAGVPVVEVSKQYLYDRLIKRSKRIEENVFRFLEQTISLIKSNYGSVDLLLDRAKKDSDKRTESIITNVIVPLYETYTAELTRRGEVDFMDCIARATNHCAEGEMLRLYYG